MMDRHKFMGFGASAAVAMAVQAAAESVAAYAGKTTAVAAADKGDSKTIIVNVRGDAEIYSAKMLAELLDKINEAVVKGGTIIVS